MYSTFNPFNGEEISQIVKNSVEGQNILKILSDTLTAIDTGDRLYKIMNFS